MLKKLFGLGKKVTEETVFSPLTGKMVALEEVPDPVFAGKMMGEGAAVLPEDGKVVSPVKGEIIQVFHTKHAVGIRSEGGAEILIHIGLETVSMNGEGFEAHVKEGDKVNVGTPLISFDLELVKQKAKSTVTPVIITNGDAAAAVSYAASEAVTRGSSALLHIAYK